MQATLQKLIEVYERERELYGDILGRVGRQRDLIAQGADYGEINEELKLKRDLLVEIEGMENAIGRDRELWRRHRHTLDGVEAQVLMKLLADVAALVEEIMSQERENEILLTSRRRQGRRAAVSAQGAAAQYRRHSLAEVER